MFRRTWLATLMLIGTAASAELQNIEAGGSVEVYGAWYSDVYESNPDLAVRIPAEFLPKRPIGPYGTESWYSADGKSNSFSFVEQRTRLHVDADLTDHIRGFVELDDSDTWGTDFRSVYATGADPRADSSDDVELFQSYIELQEMGGLPLVLRIGRQEISFGSGWLVGTNPIPDPLTGLSFDAVRGTWTPGKFTLDAWWSKLAESGAAEEDGDVDFGGLYASYAWTPEIVFDAYWMWLRDARAVNDTNATFETEWVENWLGYDNYDPTNLHTVGLRSAGVHGAVDWEAEAAYQFGNADSVDSLFHSGTYGDNRAEWNTWGAHAEAGYTFSTAWQPRVYTHAMYLGGEDRRSLSFAQWLNPFYRPKASISFNRLFSDQEHDAFFDGSAITNSWEWCAGASASPVESVELWLCIQYQAALEGFDRPAGPHFGNWALPLMPSWSFWTEPGAKDLGWQVSLGSSYSYSEDLSFEAGYTHLFGGDGLDDGAFVDENGLRFVGGRDNDGADYFYGYTKLEF